LHSIEPTVRASVLTALPGYLKAKGVDARELLDAAGIPRQALDDPQLAIPFGATALLFDIAARRLGDPAFGLSYGKYFPRGGTGLLGQIVLTAPTVRDVFTALSRLVSVHMSPVVVRFDESEGIGRFAIKWPPTLGGPRTQLTGFYLACLVLRIRLAAGESWCPLSVEFQFREPAVLAPYHEIFGTRLSFECKQNVITLDATTLARKMPEIDAFDTRVQTKLHENLLELGERKVKEQAQAASIAERLQGLLSSRLANEMAFDLETVAAEIGLPARALQWRLEQEETSYEKVLLATRFLETERYLRDSSYQLTRIAALLGFSELSAFTRWSQKHFRMSPSALRQHLRSGGRMVAPAANSPGDDAS